MRATCIVGALILATGSCESSRASVGRATLVRQGPSLFQVMPAPEQHAYCTIFTVSEAGVTRQLTMSRDNLAFDCPAGRAVGYRTWRAPADEGPVRVLVFFSSQKLNAASIAQQLIEMKDPRRASLLDMRLPGTASLETLEFTPLPESPIDEGGIINGAPGAEPKKP
jgi:hypothetical protein